MASAVPVKFYTREAVEENRRIAREKRQDGRPNPSDDLMYAEKRDFFAQRDEALVALEKMQASRPLKPPGRR